MGTDVPIFALPPVPHYGGRVLVRLCNVSGAQNLSGFLRFIPGHWALVFPKLWPVRFPFRAWLCRAGDRGAVTCTPEPSPSKGEGAENMRGG